MAHINIATSITRNRKFKRFKRHIDKDDASAIGHLACLWTNVMELAEDGDVSKWTKEDIAEYAQYNGDPQRFYEALTQKNASFFEINGKRRLVANWWQYAGRYLTAKYRTNNPELLKEIRELYQSDVSPSVVGNNTTNIDKIDKIYTKEQKLSVLSFYQELKGWSSLTNYPQLMKEARVLLAFTKSVEVAKEALTWIGGHLDTKGLDWRLATAIRWLPEWEKSGKVSDKAKAFMEKWGGKDGNKP